MDLKLNFKQIFPEGGPARYNVAAWQKADKDHVVLVGREVQEPGANETPDIGKLVLFEIDKQNRIIHERILWESLNHSFFLEDPRALVHSDGSITIALAMVLKTRDGYSSFPAVVKIDSVSTWSGELPPISLIHAYGSGKNLTPIKQNKFLFRPESEDYHHKLLFFDLSNVDPESTYDIEFPTNLDWALWRIGTTMPPLWFGGNSALLIIHGITIKEGEYIYSIGRAKLHRKEGHFVVDVHPEPIITPDTFVKEGRPLEEELHPGLRRVVYACGGVIKRNEPESLYLYVNVGDRNTYEVKVAVEDLKEGLFD
jgi:hypothetical protein